MGSLTEKVAPFPVGWLPDAPFLPSSFLLLREERFYQFFYQRQPDAGAAGFVGSFSLVKAVEDEAGFPARCPPPYRFTSRIILRVPPRLHPSRRRTISPPWVHLERIGDEVACSIHVGFGVKSSVCRRVSERRITSRVYHRMKTQTGNVSDILTILHQLVLSCLDSLALRAVWLTRSSRLLPLRQIN